MMMSTEQHVEIPGTRAGGTKHCTARVQVLAADDGECMVIGKASEDADE